MTGASATMDAVNGTPAPLEVIALVGPTASGKSDLSLALAERLGGGGEAVIGVRTAADIERPAGLETVLSDGGHGGVPLCDA